jgi:phosphoserine aminotransferase
MVEKVLRWVTNLGGLTAIEQINEQKAATLYARIDKSDFYRGTALPDSRSRMNVTFRVGTSEEVEAQFISEAAKANLTALKGYRTVGGIRASIYNACSQDSVDALVSFMDEFERTNG